jgi:hypothetical protein
MEKITRTDLKNMRVQFTESEKKNCIAQIIEQVKRSAQTGQVSYTHIHQGDIQNVFPYPLEVVHRLRAVFVDVDIDYAEPYISIRWN